jgi:hypothetical protein
VSLFPTTPDNPTPVQQYVGWAHVGFAAALFATLAYFSLALFTRTDKPLMGNRKRMRNRVYRACGWIIVSCVAGIGITALMPAGAWIHRIQPTFWLEATAIVAFGVSWATKGEAILKDRPAEAQAIAVPGRVALQ